LRYGVRRGDRIEIAPRPAPELAAPEGVSREVVGYSQNELDYVGTCRLRTDWTLEREER